MALGILLGKSESQGEVKRSLAAKLNSLRAGVLGANDGIVSIAGLVVGVAAVNPTDTRAIALAGIAGVIAASGSMAMGEYVSVSTQRDSERAVLLEHQSAIAADPAGQEAELAQHYQDKGISAATAAVVAAELSAQDPLRAHLDAEHGIDPGDLTNPWNAAFASFVAFILGAALPIATILLTSPAWRIPFTYVAVVVALALTGLISARLGQARVGPAVVRVVAGGALAMGLAWIIGHLLGVQGLVG